MVAELHEKVFFSEYSSVANTFIHTVPWPQASFVSCLTDLADTRRPWLETDGRSGTAGVRQMAACMSPGPRLAAILKKDGPK